MLEPIGVRIYGELGESWEAYWILPPTMSDEEILENIYGAHYGGPGEVFSERPYIQRTNTRVLVTQFGGRDI